MRFERLFLGSILWSVGAMGGCAAHQTGLIRQLEGHTQLMDLGANGTKLRLTEASQGLKVLDGPSVEVWGKRGFSGAIVVERYKIQEGNHGLPVWFGQLQRHGEHIGLSDENSGVFYAVDEPAWTQLQPLLGETVMLEGFVDGPHRIKVLHFLVLEGQSAGQTGSFDINAR